MTSAPVYIAGGRILTETEHAAFQAERLARHQAAMHQGRAAPAIASAPQPPRPQPPAESKVEPRFVAVASMVKQLARNGIKPVMTPTLKAAIAAGAVPRDSCE